MSTLGKYAHYTRQHTTAALGLLAVVVASAILLAVYAGGDNTSTHAVNSSHRQAHDNRDGNSKRLAVFSRHLRVRTRFAKGSSLTGPSVLARIIGSMQVYLSEKSGLICIRIREGIVESAGCAHAEEIQTFGNLNVRGNGAGQIGIVMVLPNGVGSVTLVDHDGQPHQIAVTNNVAGAYDSQVESVAYRLADGALHTVRLPTGFLHPKPPKLPRDGSAKSWAPSHADLTGA